jgi:hypothetical protein
MVMKALSGLPKVYKFVTAVIGQGLTFAALYYGTNHWVVAAVAAASALGVYAVPNRQGTPAASATNTTGARPAAPVSDAP